VPGRLTICMSRKEDNVWKRRLLPPRCNHANGFRAKEKLEQRETQMCYLSPSFKLYFSTLLAERDSSAAFYVYSLLLRGVPLI